MHYRFVLLALASLPAAAQTPSQALAQKIGAICANAPSGTELQARCDELAASSDPFAAFTFAIGQHLEEIPGQARVGTRGNNIPTGSIKATAKQHLALLPNGTAATLLDAEASVGLAPNWSLFASVEVGKVERRQGQNEAAFDANTTHATLGVNRQLGERFLLGAAFNLDREALDYRGTVSTADARYTGLLGMVTYSISRDWTLDAYSGSTRGNFTLARSIHFLLPRIGGGSFVVDALATAAPDSQRNVRGIALAWNTSHGAWQSDLVFGLDESRTRIDSYIETGGKGLALAVPGRSVETRRGRIDARMSRTYSQPWGVWQPSLRLGWRQEFGNERRPVTLHLALDPFATAITFDTEDPDRGWGELALGSVFTFTHGHSAFVEYRQRFAHAFLQERVLAIGWRMEL